MAQFPEVSFLTSAWQPQQFPSDVGAEVAFAGRSNAGKSSALNALVGRRDLARTSKTPGRTQLINFFALSSPWRLVDLPGYGYAKVPLKMQEHWRELLSGYVRSRVSLAGVVIVVDARRGLSDYDQQLLGFVADTALPIHLLLTKADKLNRSESVRTLREVTAQVTGRATAQLFSAVSGDGLEPFRRMVLAMLRRASEKKNPDDSTSHRGNITRHGDGPG
jgi:GTP-binding protein